MYKQDFLKEIKYRLKDFNNDETKKLIEYYDELINDYMDEGLSEEEAIAKLGDVDKIINDIKADLVIERSKSKNTNSLKNFIIILSICTSPVLIPLGITFFVLFFVLLLTLFVLFISFAGSSAMFIFSSIYTTIEMIIVGTDVSSILIAMGLQLILGVIFGILSIGLYNFSKLSLNFLNKQFSKFVKKKSKKEIREND